MTVDYYALLTKAITGKDTLGRDRIYKDAYDFITRSHLNREVAASHVAALEAAIRRIEDVIAGEEGRNGNEAAINEVLRRAQAGNQGPSAPAHSPLCCQLWSMAMLVSVASVNSAVASQDRTSSTAVATVFTCPRDLSAMLSRLGWSRNGSTATRSERTIAKATGCAAQAPSRGRLVSLARSRSPELNKPVARLQATKV